MPANLPPSPPLLRFLVPGIPATSGSKRAFPIYRGGNGAREFTGRVAVVENDRRARPWRADVRAAALQALAGGSTAGGPLAGALRVNLSFGLPRPKHVSMRETGGYPIRRPDVDKLSRAVLDSLKGLVWNDDAQVVEKCVRKWYSPSPGVLVVILRPRYAPDAAAWPDLPRNLTGSPPVETR